MEEANIDKIEDLLNTKKFFEAFEMIDNILKENGDEKDDIVEILEASGENFISEEDNESAEKVFKKEILIEPVNGYFNLGLVYIDMNRNDDAIGNFKKSTDYGNNSADIYKFIGMAYMNKEDYDNAIIHLNKSVSIEENFENNHYLGLSYLGKENYDGAIKFFNRACDIKENYETLHYLGLAHLGKENYDEAINFFTKSLNRNTDFADAYYYRGMAYYAIENEIEAIKDYKKACDLNNEYLDLPYECY
ncbi:MAG: hypothetical protein BWK75_04545 [Candidatus Altiarchaeales archaeon A3]|nr:MAG: hypothetical protein BWK75_04545 [Candidatus Altiarchaeales archaeon A3]